MLLLTAIASRSDSDFECSNVSLKENKPDGVNPNSNDIDYYVRKNEGKILWFSADCFITSQNLISFQSSSFTSRNFGGGSFSIEDVSTHGEDQ